MRIDFESLATTSAQLAGLRIEQVPGFAMLFRMVAREAFMDGFCAAKNDVLGEWSITNVRDAWQVYEGPRGIHPKDVHEP